MRSLFVYPTHANCLEIEETLVSSGVDACTYPGRLTSDDDKREQNCWNDDANEAEKMGFSVVTSVCPSCSHQSECWRFGYLRQMADASEAHVALCTHKRIEFAGLTEFVASRQYLSIHENPVNLLRPQTKASLNDLIQIQMVLNRILNDPFHLDWFGAAKPQKIRGRLLEGDEVLICKERQYRFCLRLADLVDDLVQRVFTAERTTELIFPHRHSLAEGVERTLFRATRRAQAKIQGQPWRFVLAAMTGALHSAAIVVTRRKSSTAGGSASEEELNRFAVGFGNNTPPADMVTWFSDATMTVDLLRSLLGASVNDATPAGRLELQKKAIQIPRDITRQTAVSTVARLLRGVLTDRAEVQRAGLICHRTHLAVLTEMESIFANRIVKSAYFGSGEERSSNAWQHECDLIIVAGTPRVPPDDVAIHLIQIGEIGAACRDVTWGPLKWETRTEAGQTVVITGSGYADPVWRRGHQNLVRATLVQAIGRGRGILEDGCEVVVLSTEECGLPISDGKPTVLNKSAAMILTRLKELSPENSIYNYIEKSGVKTAQLATETGLSVSVVRGNLSLLENLGRVCKIGERGGWRPVAQESFHPGDAIEPTTPDSSLEPSDEPKRAGDCSEALEDGP